MNVSLLITALMSAKMPNELIPGVVESVSHDFPHSKVVTDYMQLIVANAADAPMVFDLLLRIEEDVDVPPGLRAAVEYLKTLGAPGGMQIAQTVSIIEAAINDSESWIAKHPIWS